MTEGFKPLTLTQEEKHSPLWRALCAHWQARIDVLHAQNEGDKTEAQTANLRGRIAECKANLALAKDKPEID